MLGCFDWLIARERERGDGGGAGGRPLCQGGSVVDFYRCRGRSEALLLSVSLRCRGEVLARDSLRCVS